MEEVSLSMARLIRIWWAFTWRFIVLNVALGFALVVILAFASLALRVNPASLERATWLQLVLVVISCVAFLLVLRWVLELKWVDFRIALVRVAKDTAPAPAAADHDQAQ